MPNLSDYFKLSEDDRTARLAPTGIVLDDPATWTDANCAQFERLFPGYKADFFLRHTFIPKNYGEVECREEKLRIVLYRNDQYEMEFEPGYCDTSYNGIRLRRNLGDAVYPEQPVNVEHYSSVFSKSNAKTLRIEDWDVSEAKNVMFLFYGNKFVEEIDMPGWIYPEKAWNNFTEPVLMGGMFSGCTNLKRLSFTTPRSCLYYPEAYIAKTALEGCFKDCKNLEYVRFYRGSRYQDAYIGRIKEASEKEVEIRDDGTY